MRPMRARVAFRWADACPKVLFAWYFNDPNLLISSYITADSRIMIRRTIQGAGGGRLLPSSASTATPTW